MKNKWYSPGSISLAVIYMLFIISFSVVVTLNFRPLYYFDIGYLDIGSNTGFPENEIKENYDALIDYNSIFSRGELNFPTLDMSDTGRIHFVEVKNIFTDVQYLCIASFLAAFVWTIFKAKKKDFGFLFGASLLTVCIPAALGVLIALNWDKFFVTFHKIFFNNDYWIFDAATDPVITILPDTFFMHAALMILGVIVLGSTLCFSAGKILARQSRKK